MRPIAIPLLLVALAACNGRGPGGETPVPEPGSALERIRALNAAARRGSVVEEVHGREIADPFRALEEDSEETWDWIDGQTAVAREYFETHADPNTAERLAALMAVGSIRRPMLGGDRIFYTKRDGDADQPVLLVIDPDRSEPRTLVDPNALGARVTIDWLYPSPAGRFLAYGLSREGDERSVLHVLDADSGEPLDEAIPHAKWTNFSWLNDETGFYYTRYPAEGEPDWVDGEVDVYFPHLFFHLLDGAPGDGSADALVHRLAVKTDFVGPAVSPDDRWLVLNLFHGWSQSEVFLLDRREPAAEPIPVDAGGDYLTAGEVHGDRLYLMTNQDHPRYRIVAVPLDTPADRSTWREIVPEGEWSMESFAFSRGLLAVEYMENVASAIRLFGPDGTPAGRIDLPAPGSIAGPAVSSAHDRVAFEFDSFFHPPALYEYDPGTGTLREVDRVASDVDPSRYEVERAAVPSRVDGTEVNVFLARERDIPRDGNRPVLLYGYGGFNVSLVPYFRSHALYWLERGAILATANLRGGSEFGEAWHRDGMLENKHKVFEDFEAVIRWLPSTGWTRPERIAIYGASNGGLLMGAMIARCPDAFRAAASYVGLYDMVRFHRFPPAEIWMSELGDPEDPDAFAWLLDYSPYHNLVDGTAYPAALIETAERDTRVSWKHSTKFAARLQEANASTRPILFYLDRSVGHGAGTGLADAVAERVRMYDFLETELGMR
jgi:prolyl oligopeptidase